MDVQIVAGSTLTPPAAGYKTLFINTEDGNILSWMDSAGTITRFTDNDNDTTECACEIAKISAQAWSCALEKGIITSAEYAALVLQGMNISVTATDDGAGNTSTVINIGPKV